MRKIDIISWDENPAIDRNALNPAKVIAVMADPDREDCTCCSSDYSFPLQSVRKGRMPRL